MPVPRRRLPVQSGARAPHSINQIPTQQAIKKKSRQNLKIYGSLVPLGQE
jgi:hypothetical protein